MPDDTPPMPPADQVHRLRLEPIAGPRIEPIEIDSTRSHVLGRGTASDVPLPHETVSRQHARLTPRGRTWYVSDEGGRHGTYLNGVKLGDHDAVALADGDMLRIGPWTMRVGVGGGTGHSTAATTLSVDADRGRVETIPARELGSLAEHRLQLLMDCATIMNEADDEQSLVDALLESSIAGSGFPRAALLRLIGSEDQVEILGHRDITQENAELTLSQSLIREASGGQLARLVRDPMTPVGHSIIQLRIHSAICAPIVVGSTVTELLYLDAREHESGVQPDAAGFCQFIARLCGLALANLRRQELERRNDMLQADLNAAREAQQFLVPQEQGSVGRIRYAARTRPGRFVAGDLFDVVPLADGRVAVCLGDVTGEGVPAAILMASTQSHLHASLAHDADLERAVNAVNRYVAARSASNKFISLWVGVFDPAAGTLRYVDAGHGYWIHLPAGGEPRDEEMPRDLLLGIVPDYAYAVHECEIGPGDRIVLFSDGLVEQTGAGGEQFGRERIMDILRASAQPAEDVAQVFDAVCAFAGVPDLSDDSSVASIEIAAVDR